MRIIIKKKKKKKKTIHDIYKDAISEEMSGRKLAGRDGIYLHLKEMIDGTWPVLEPERRPTAAIRDRKA